MFYRLAKFFFKKDGSLAYRAVTIVTIIQGLLMGSLITVIVRLFYSISETAQYSKLSGKVGVIVFIILLALNYRRYRRGYSRFSDRWRNAETPKQKRRNGYLVVIGIVATFAIFLYLGTAAHRQ